MVREQLNPKYVILPIKVVGIPKTNQPNKQKTTKKNRSLWTRTVWKRFMEEDKNKMTIEVYLNMPIWREGERLLGEEEGNVMAVERYFIFLLLILFPLLLVLLLLLLLLKCPILIHKVLEGFSIATSLIQLSHVRTCFEQNASCPWRLRSAQGCDLKAG